MCRISILVYKRSIDMKNGKAGYVVNMRVIGVW